MTDSIFTVALEQATLNIALGYNAPSVVARNVLDAYSVVRAEARSMVWGNGATDEQTAAYRQVTVIARILLAGRSHAKHGRTEFARERLATALWVSKRPLSDFTGAFFNVATYQKKAAALA